MVINNFENIKKFLNFDKEGDFHFIQIFKRRKENINLPYPQKRIKCYTIYSMEDLFEVYPKIQLYCSENNARAYISLNTQNAIEVSHKCIEQISKNLRLGNYHKNEKVWDSIAGKDSSKEHWLIDVDKEHFEFNSYIVSEICNLIKDWFQNYKPNIDPKLSINKTKSGVHIISKSFDSRLLNTINSTFQNERIPKIQILKDCNTLLYYENIQTN